jgi:hypothetical protein
MNAGMNANVAGLGAFGSGEVGTDSSGFSGKAYGETAGFDTTRQTRTEDWFRHPDAETEASARVSVSALSSVPETRANWINRFPFYDVNYQLRTIEVYTFAVPDPDLRVSSRTESPQFREDMAPGSVFVESAGGVGSRPVRVIQHSPNPKR